MSRGLVRTSRYSPGNMTGEALEQLFVGRDDLMKDILKRINASAIGKEKHFILLVGPRGMGKTHFVSLAYHKLKKDPAYAKALSRLKIAYLNEEEWGVASFLDFLVRILRALVAQHQEPSLQLGIDRIYETFKKNQDAALELAESLLIDYLRGSTLLLICENLEDLFEGLGDEGQKRWRSFIQEHAFWTILATTPSLFSGVQLQSSPFYNFFTIKPLKRLDFDTATELLRQKALIEGRTGLAEFLLTPTGRARVRAIHHLAGGNHRVYVILSDFLDEESLEELVGPFMRMADDLTPYYQDRMRQLAPQQRKIVEFLCQESRPVIVKDIASRCLISQQVAAKQLGELAKLQFVLSTKVGRESYYELAEPLMRICVDIKDNRTEHFRLFVVFLRYWFTGRELHEKFDLLKQAIPEAQRIDRLHLFAAIQDLAQDPREPFLDHLDAEIRRCIENQNHHGVVDALLKISHERPSAYGQTMLAAALLDQRQYQESLEAAERARQLDPKYPPAMLAIAWALNELQRYAEAEQTLQQLPENEAINQHRFNALFLALERQKKYVEAVALAESVPENYLAQAQIHTRYSNALIQLSRFEDALIHATKSLELNPHDSTAHGLKTLALLHLNKLEDAAESARKALLSGALPEASPEFLDIILTAGQPEEVLAQISRLEKQAGTMLPLWNQRSKALILLSRYQEALHVIKQARQADPKNIESALIEVEALAGDSGFGAALRALGLLLEKQEAPQQDPELFIDTIHDLLALEDHLRGATAMARQLPLLLNVLGRDQAKTLMPAVLSNLLDDWIESERFTEEEWTKALPLLESALADIAECRIALEMLSVAVRYQQSGDKSVLLELPLEQRTLLLEKMGIE